MKKLTMLVQYKFALVTALGLSLAACGGGGGSPGASDAASADAAVVDSQRHPVSVTGTAIPPSMSINDASGAVWTVQNGVIYRAGARTVSSNVTLLLWYSGVIYQENSSNAWWQWQNNGWVSSSDPRIAVEPPVTTPPVVVPPVVTTPPVTTPPPVKVPPVVKTPPVTTTPPVVAPTTAVQFFGVNGHYNDGGPYTANIAQQVKDMQAMGIKSIRQDAGSMAQMTTLANLIPQFAPVVIQPIFNQYPSASTSEATAYSTYYAYGVTNAQQFAGKVPVIELMNEPEVQYFPSGPANNGQNITDMAASNNAWPAFRGAVRGFIDGFRSIDTTKKTLIASPSVGWLHYGILDGLWKGTAPDGSSGHPTARWDLTNYHWYEDFGNIENAGNTNTNVLQYLKTTYGLPIVLTEVGVQKTESESAIDSYVSTEIPFYSANAAKYGIVGLSWYELYNFQNLNGFYMGLYSAQGAQNAGRAAAMKSVIAASGG
jgi:hypothetical protein